MKFSKSWLAVPAEILFFISSVAASTPLAAHVVRDVHLIQKPRTTNLEVAAPYPISRRGAGIILGSASLATQLDNQQLFSIGLDGVVSIAGSPNLTATCISCFTTGTATLLTSGFAQDQALLADIPAAAKQLLENPKGFVEEALNVTFEIDFQDLAGHFEVDISFDAAGALSFPLFHPVTPLGASLEGNEIGFLFTIDLVFSVTGQLDVTTGFDISWPNSTSITIDPIKGEVLSMDVSGVQLSPLPLKFRSGTACIEVALRFGLKAGLGINILGTGVTIEAGVFADAPAYKACANFNSSAACELSLTQTVFADAGAFADIAAKADFVNFKEGPSAVTTFFVATLPSTCLASSTTLAIASTGFINATGTAAPLYSNATSTVQYTSATTTATSNSSVEVGNSSVITLTSCQSNTLWCPPNLQTTIMITQTAASSTGNASIPSPVIITNPIYITAYPTPQVSTVQSTASNNTTSPAMQPMMAMQTSMPAQTSMAMASGGNFGQQSMNMTTTQMVASTTSTKKPMSSVWSANLGNAIAKANNMTTTSNSTLSNSTPLAQATSDAGLARSADSNIAALVIGVLGLILLV